jgi:predicted CxxxxCH...CXXCH cytochrome family protein
MSERRWSQAPRRASARGAALSLWLAIAGAAGAALASPGCLERRDEPASDPEATRCTSCHGDPERPGDFLQRAAPPFDLLRQSDPGYPGVGAHEIHLNAGDTHPAFACTECHVVPETVDTPGHADDGSPGDVVFGPLGTQGDRNPYYDSATRTCESSYCHREARAVWSEPRDSADACGTCHGLPPAAPHPQSDRCELCHGEVIDESRRIIAPERHVDGIVDYVAGECNTCHGSDENAAPPLDTLGNQATSELGVGAHQVHLSGGSNGRALGCDECHHVPDEVEDPLHVDGLPAEVVFTGVANAEGRSPLWNAVSATCTESYCHGPSPGDTRESPAWNVEAELSCSTCHGLPPPLPHPQSEACSACHGDVVAPDNRTIIAKALHVNGSVDTTTGATCTSCHGGDNPAPPVDTRGVVSTAFASVGAHQTHVLGTERSRAVPCAECHQVPKEVLEAGHVDSALPAELTFSGVALAHGATPSYEQGTCQSTSCHGAVFPEGHLSGGSNTAPTWNRVNGMEAACGSCHGIPPPRPHPLPGNPCQNCHENVAEDGLSFTHPELHVDGIVTFDVE